MRKKTILQMSEKELKDVENLIKNYFSSQHQDNIKKALLMCTEYGIDSDQFSLYFKPEEDKNHEQLIIEKKQDAISESEISSQSNHVLANETSTPKEETNDKILTKIKKPISFIKLREFREENESHLFDFFPYKTRNLLTLSEKNLVRIINGCFSSYSSREIIRVFNPREYLGKMSVITNLRSDYNYITDLYFSLKHKVITETDAFDKVISDLDDIAYKKNRWSAESLKLGKNRFSVANNEQKERITYIPKEEKTRFVLSILYKKKDYVRNHNYSALGNYDSRLKGTKKGYVDFLLEQLLAKWDNKDTVR